MSRFLCLYLGLFLPLSSLSVFIRVSACVFDALFFYFDPGLTRCLLSGLDPICPIHILALSLITWKSLSPVLFSMLDFFLCLWRVPRKACRLTHNLRSQSGTMSHLGLVVVFFSFVDGMRESRVSLFDRFELFSLNQDVSDRFKTAFWVAYRVMYMFYLVCMHIL